MHPLVTPEQVQHFQEHGAVLIKGLFAEYVDVIREGIDINLQQPGEYAAENLTSGESGRFFDDYCNWQRIAPFRQVAFESGVGEVAANLMGSQTAQLFHDHVLVKEAGTSKPTPWHQDSPYYFVEGKHTVSFWVPVDPVSDATLRCVAGSHRWESPVLPVKWLKEDSFYPDESQYRPVPDPDAESDMTVLEWPMAPGDAVAFHFRTLHGARGNQSSQRRRAFSLRVTGDDARYVTRPGKTSPPFPGHDMNDGDQLREDWFPVIYRR